MTNHNFADEDFEEWGPTAGLTPDGASKYLDTNFPATSLRDDAHLCYIEQQPAADAALPSYTSQITWTSGTGFDTWKNIFSRGQATMQPVAALVNGDVDLVTYWYTLGMFDQLVK